MTKGLQNQQVENCAESEVFYAVVLVRTGHHIFARSSIFKTVFKLPLLTESSTPTNRDKEDEAKRNIKL